MLSRRDEMRLQRAIRESPQNKRREELRKRVDELRKNADREKQKMIDAFHAWAEADLHVRILEEILDANNPDSEAYCIAVHEMPEAKAAARDLWLDYSTMKGGDNQ